MKRNKKPGNPFERLVAWHSRKPWQVHLSLAGVLALFIVTCLATAQGIVHAQLSPSVNITAPTDGSTISGSSVALSATASGGTSTALDFIFSDVSNTTIGATSTNAGATWTASLDSTTFSDGATTLIASSTIDGANVTSTVINLTIHNAPVVTVTSPTNGATVSGSNVPLAATISAGVSTTASALDFVFSDTSGTTINATSTDGVSWTASLDSTTFQDGATTLVASSTVNGANVTSTLINLTVHNAPSVVILSPANNATISGSNVTLSATTTGGVTTALNFVFNGSSSTLVSATSTNGQTNWIAHFDSTTLNNGTSTLVASSTMNGVNVTSSVISVNVNNGGGGGGSGGGIPTVTIISPVDGSNVTGTLALVATVTNGTATDFAFTAGGEDIGTSGGGNPALHVTEGPIGTWSLTPIDSGFLPDGPFTITAKATVNGSVIVSQPVTPTLGGGPPGVRFLDPAIFGGNHVFTQMILEAKLYGGTGSEPITLKINGQPADTNHVFFFPAGLPGIYLIIANSEDLPPGEFTIEADSVINDTPVASAPLTMFNVGIPQGSIVQPLDCQVKQADQITLSTRVDRDVPKVNYVVTNDFPKNLPNQNALDQLIIPAVYNNSSHTWDAVWDATGKEVGTYKIQSIGSDFLGVNQIDFGHVSVAIGVQCYYQTPAGISIPKLGFVSPLTNAVVSGTVPLIVSAPAAASVGFDIYSRGAGVPQHLAAVQQDAGWVASWDTTQGTNGSYTITPSAVNMDGVGFTGDNILVNVLNSMSSASTTGMATTTLDLATSTDLTSFMPTVLSFDPTATGTYAADVALALNPSIDADAGVTSASSTPGCAPGSLIKLPDDRNRKTATDAVVYYCAQDGQRYAFPTAKVFFSWYSDFSSVTIIDADRLQSIPIGGIVHYRPGSRMVKVPADPKVYAVARGGTLRWITTEGLARQLYGDDWNTKVDDLFDGFFDTYQVGEPITEGSQAPAPAVADTSTTTTQATSTNSDNATKK